MAGKSPESNDSHNVESHRGRAAVYAAIERAGHKGILRATIVKALGVHTTTVGHRLAELLDPTDKKIHICGWCQPSIKWMPLYAVGNLPDVPRPKIWRIKKKRDPLPKDVDKLAKAEITRAHRKWMETWEPRMDPAAAWMVDGPA
ncbi:hypothetical protein [Cupriavidus gilardii]|uniref:hypothetical protein n=1 Tax=Cupriavidus gilardii TaxID=82541 RepID=UPI002B28E0DA|nr:hypothetical protein QWJ31_19705 [Cupriavidus gilardii]